MLIKIFYVRDVFYLSIYLFYLGLFWVGPSKAICVHKVHVYMHDKRFVKNHDDELNLKDDN